MKQMRKRMLRIFLLILLCSSSVKAGEKPLKIKNISLTINAAVVRTGDKVKIIKTLKPENAAKRRLKWISSNNKYAMVDDLGNVSVKAAGAKKKVRITAKSIDGSKKKASITFTILPAVNPKKPMVALTFDDGPKGSITRSIVNTLKNNFSVATFFTIGTYIKGAENIKALKAVSENGNEIGNHTFSHANLTNCSDGKIKNEILRTAELVKKYTGRKISVMRPPYGRSNKRVKDTVGIPVVGWTVDTRDWQTLNTNQTYHTVMSQVKDKSIILMHDCYKQSADAAKKIIPELRRRGYQLVTVSELMKYRKT